MSSVPATLNISEVSRAINNMPKSIDPKEMTKLIMGLSQGTKKTSKPSKLPVKKGSNVSFTSDKRTKEDQQAPEAVSSSGIDLHMVENARLAELRMVGEISRDMTGKPRQVRDVNRDMIEKSNPDGEESDYSISPISGSNNVSPREEKIDSRVQEIGRKSEVRRSSEEIRVRSPRSGMVHMGLTGHHIPDGADYSIRADYPHQVKMGRSREDMDGTDDIQMADSRVFDLVSSADGGKGVGSDVSHQGREISERLAPYIVQEEYESDPRTERDKLSDRNTFPSVIQEKRNEMHLQADMGAPRSFSMSGVDKLGNSQSSHKAASAIEKQQLDLHEQYANNDDRLLVNNTPREASAKSSAYRERVRHSSGGENSSVHSHERSERTVSHKYTVQHDYTESPRSPTQIYEQISVDDRTLMPPPPKPGLRNNLLANHQTSEKPLLLTSQSMMQSDFAQQFLMRDNPRVVSSNPRQPISDELSMMTPDKRMPVMSQHEDNLSIYHQPPAYHSTPFDRDVGVMSQRFMPLDPTLSTSTLAESRLSMGTYNESSSRPAVHSSHKDGRGVYIFLLSPC